MITPKVFLTMTNITSNKATPSFIFKRSLDRYYHFFAFEHYSATISITLLTIQLSAKN